LALSLEALVLVKPHILEWRRTIHEHTIFIILSFNKELAAGIPQPLLQGLSELVRLLSTKDSAEHVIEDTVKLRAHITSLQVAHLSNEC
jgi:hypothetical protein